MERIGWEGACLLAAHQELRRTNKAGFVDSLGALLVGQEERGPFLALGEEAILKVKPDLAVLDLMMEEKDSGFVLSHEFKKLYPDMPVILLTAVAGATGLSFTTQGSDAQSWIKVDKIMDKPVRPEQLRAEVSRLLGEDLPDAHGGHS